MNSPHWILDVLFILLIAFLIYRIVDEVSRKSRLRSLGKRLNRSIPEMIVVLNNEFSAVQIHNYDPDILPLLEEEIMNSNLWEVLPPELATIVYKGYQDARDSGSMVTMDYTSEMQNYKSYELRFVPLHEKFVTCFIRETTDKNK